MDNKHDKKIVAQIKTDGDRFAANGGDKKAYEYGGKVADAMAEGLSDSAKEETATE